MEENVDLKSVYLLVFIEFLARNKLLFVLMYCKLTFRSQVYFPLLVIEKFQLNTSKYISTKYSILLQNVYNIIFMCSPNYIQVFVKV